LQRAREQIFIAGKNVAFKKAFTILARQAVKEVLLISRNTENVHPSNRKHLVANNDSRQNIFVHLSFAFDDLFMISLMQTE
jgi:hypothetical protein